MSSEAKGWLELIHGQAARDMCVYLFFEKFQGWLIDTNNISSFFEMLSHMYWDWFNQGLHIDTHLDLGLIGLQNEEDTSRSKFKFDVLKKVEKE